MNRIDELSMERYAVMADQALCETEALEHRRLGRQEAERIVERELRRRTMDLSRPGRAALIARVTALLLDERGYLSGLDGRRVRPGEEEDRPSFLRLLGRSLAG